MTYFPLHQTTCFFIPLVAPCKPLLVWLFCCLYLGSIGRMEDYICMEKIFLSLIKTRRSVRAYKSEPVPSKALDAVLEAGTYPAQEAGQPAARKQNYIVRI